MSIIDTIKNALHNRNLYRTGKANKGEVRSTTVGWQQDQNQIKTAGDASPSGQDEYHTVVRDNKKKEK